MTNDTDIICTFDKTFDGFLSAIYHVIKSRIRPIEICPENDVQMRLDAKIIHIPTEIFKAESVSSAICNRMGYDGFKRVYHAFLNSEPTSATSVYKYLLYGFKYGTETKNLISVPEVFKAYELERAVLREADRLQGFLRFSVMEGGVQYAPFEPVHDLLPVITPHFTDRLKTIPFVIHDLKREKAAVYNTTDWSIFDVHDITLPSLSEDEENFRSLWKEFYRAVTIKERKNERLQNQMLPKMYRKHMVEFT